jgi:hypothetical protein
MMIIKNLFKEAAIVMVGGVILFVATFLYLHTLEYFNI